MIAKLLQMYTSLGIKIQERSQFSCFVWRIFFINHSTGNYIPGFVEPQGRVNTSIHHIPHTCSELVVRSKGNVI